jgi:hypothetical protein
VIRFLVWGTMPIGALAGGAIGSLIGLHAALWVGAIGALFSFVPIALSPVRSIATMPEPTLEEPVADEAIGPMTAVPAEQSA